MIFWIMLDELANESLTAIIGRPGQIIPRLSSSEKLRIKQLLSGQGATALDASSRLRASVAVGRIPRDVISDPDELRRSLHARDVVANLGKLAISETVVHLSAPLRAIRSRLDRSSALSLVRALPKLVLPRRKRSDQKPTLLDPVTAELAIAALAEAVDVCWDPRHIPKASFLADIGFAFETACYISEQCRSPRALGAALEFLRIVELRTGTADVLATLEIPGQVLSTLLELPGQLVPQLLQTGCTADAEFLASRAAIFDQSQRAFERAIRSALSAPDYVLPVSSRLWAESHLGISVPVHPVLELDSDSDLTLQRFSALLISAWDARGDGPRSRDLFELMSGICATSFNLHIQAQVGGETRFDPGAHEPVSPSVLGGALVRIVRPSVVWINGPARRVVIRSLVEPLLPDNTI